MNKWLLLSAGALLANVAGAAVPTLRECMALDDPTARLACYDTVMGRPVDGAAVPAPAAAPTPAPAAPAAAAAAGAADAEFGFLKNGGTMTAHIVGKLKGWEKGTMFKLDNGQVWQAMDDSHAYYPDIPENPEVEITKGMFGFKMNIKPIGRKVGVKRIS